MPIGVIVTPLLIVFRGLIGGNLGHRMIEEFKKQMNMNLGVCTYTMGISGLGLMTYMPAVIFSRCWNSFRYWLTFWTLGTKKS